MSFRCIVSESDGHFHRENVLIPVIPALHAGARLVFVSQPEDADDLPASVSADGWVMSEWSPSEEELGTLVLGGRVRIWQHTDGHTLQHVRIDVSDPTDVWVES